MSRDRQNRRRVEQGCDCLELEELAVRFVDGELEAEQRQRLLVHIQSCRHCARLVRSLKRTVHFCHLETDPEVPENAHRQLWQRLEQLLRPHRRRQE